MKKSDIQIISNNNNFIEIIHKTKNLTREIKYFKLSNGNSVYSVLMALGPDVNFLVDLPKIINKVHRETTTTDEEYIYDIYKALLKNLPDAVQVNFYVQKKIYEDFKMMVRLKNNKKYKQLKKFMELGE